MHQETRVGTCHRQVAQTVSHMMLDHMSSSGVMHGDGRRHGEEVVKHEVKKLKNIAAVHTQFCNTLRLQRVCRPALFTSGSTISHHPAPSPPPVGTLSFSLHIWVHNLTPSHSLSASREYVVLLSLHPGPQSDTIPLPLHLQVGMSSYSVCIRVHNLTPSRSLSTSSW